MATFSSRDADAAMKNLNAEIHQSDHVVGIVRITENHRIRLYHSNKRGELPSFVFNKWKQDLRLDNDEMRRLIRGDLKGDAVLELIRSRLGL